MESIAIPAFFADDLSGSPIVLVDVGARGGVPSAWRPFRDYVRWIAFEPDEKAAQEIQTGAGSRDVVVQKALADRRGRMTLYLTRDGGDTSAYRPNHAFLRRFPNPDRFDVLGTASLEADTLDAQLETLQIRDIDVLKLDTQGSELAILRGAGATLTRSVFGIQVEVELNAMYERQPLLGDVDAFLRPFDFELFDLTPRRWTHAAGRHLQLPRGQIVWGDAVYLRNVASLPAYLQRTPDPRAALTRAVVVCLAYGMADYACEILDRVADQIGSAVEPLRDAVRQFDESTAYPPVMQSVVLDPETVRALRDIEGRRGMKLAKQIRRAIEIWTANMRT